VIAATGRACSRGDRSTLAVGSHALASGAALRLAQGTAEALIDIKGGLAVLIST
jgi:hypothetical protein